MPERTRLHSDPIVPILRADAPVLLFGGCYSNLQAAQALLAAAERLDVPPTRMICTGDVIAYGADPSATLALIRDAGVATVMGNCEESLAAEAKDCGCGFVPGSSCDRLSAAWFAHASQGISDEDRCWMAALPRRIDLVIGGRRLAVVHGSPGRINRFVFASTPAEDLTAELRPIGTDGVIGGHCGLPFTRWVDGRLWHNAGAIGLPANDGTPRGWFSLLTPRQDGIEIRILPLDYDHRGATRAMRRAGLPDEYAETLQTGIWPSFDILPPEEQAATARPLLPTAQVWSRDTAPPSVAPLPHFTDPRRTATGEAHASVALQRLETLWFNTGTLCNIACTGCYIESTPRNDRLVYLSRADFDQFLAEAATRHPELREIGFTGGEPFMNPDLPGMIEAALAGGYRTLVLTNAMRPMQRCYPALTRWHAAHGSRLALRVSLDHYTPEGHERVRGPGSFMPAIEGLTWLARSGIAVTVAARFSTGEAESVMRAGFATMFRDHDLRLDATDPAQLVLFPELAAPVQPPEVSEACWQALASRGRAVMCATSRMVLHRKGETTPSVVACTLQPYAPAFELGRSLADATGAVTLNHPYCARFCVFGGASCSAG